MTTGGVIGKAANPYVGPRAFQPGETLHGRDRETFELLNLVIAERIVLLYSPSGAGKTSLLNAGLIPSLKDEGFGVLPVVRIGLDPGRGPTIRHRNRYLASTLVSLEQDAPGGRRLATDQGDLRLDAYLERRGPADDRDDQVLVVDALEELLTLDPTDRPAKEQFMAEVGEVLRDMRRWAVFAVREDYLGALEPFVRHIPTRLTRSFRLNLLEASAARAAIQQPAQAAGVDFTDAAAQRLVDNLRRVQVQRPEGRAEEEGPYVEPVQLQVVCRRLWERLPDGAARIGTVDVDAVADIDRALAGYYAEQVSAIAAQTQMPEQTIRDWVERQLITEQGFRAQVLQGPDGAAEREVLRRLEDVHLLRAEQRRGAAWFELAHDRLIEPVRTDNAAWRERNLTPLQRQAEHWDEQHRSEGLLLRGDALVETEDRLRRDPVELSPTEWEFLDACRALARREAEAARRQRRLRWLTVGLAALLVLTLLSTVVALQQRNEARAASAQARSMAQLAALRQLTVVGADDLNGRLDRSLLLSLEALRIRDTPEARANLLAGLQRNETPVTVLSGHSNEVLDVAFSPDGRTLASAGADGLVRLWDVGRRALVSVLPKHAGRVRGVAFSPPDGRMVAWAGGDDLVGLWDVARRAPLPSLQGHERQVTAVAFSPDGKTLASSSLDGTIRLWDPALGRPLGAPLSSGAGTDRDVVVNSVAYSADGGTLAAGEDDGTIRLWSVERRVVTEVLQGHLASVTAVAFAPDGGTLASAGEDNTVRLWPLDGGRGTVLRGHTRTVTSVAFDPDDRRALVSGSLDGTTRRWDLGSGRERPVLRGQTQGVEGVAFSPDGRWLAAAARDGIVLLGDTGRRGLLAVPLAGSVGGEAVAFSPDGRLLAVGTGRRSVALYDLAPRTRRRTVPVGPGGLGGVAFSPDGRLLAAAMLDGSVVLIDPSRRVRPRTVPVGSSGLGGVAFSRDGRLLAAGATDGSVLLVDPARGSRLESLDAAEGVVTEVAFSPDGRLLAAGTDEGSVVLIDPVRRVRLAELRSGRGRLVRGVAFSRDGLLAAADSDIRGEDNAVVVWDPARQAKLQVLAHESPVSSVAFSPDGRTLVAADRSAVVLWDVPSGGRAGVFPGRFLATTGVAFGLGGRVLAVGGADGRVVLLDTDRKSWERLACAIANRNLTAAEWQRYLNPEPYRRTCASLPAG